MLPLFRPAIGIMNLLRYTPKLALIALFFLLPLLGAVFFILQTNLKAQRIIQQELLGTELTRPVVTLLTQVQVHRWQFVLKLTDSDATQENSVEIKKSIDYLIEQMDLMQKKHPHIITEKIWLDIKQQWQSIQTQNSPLKTYSQHTEVIRQLTSLISAISRNSTLTLDPEVESYFLMSAVQFRLPLLTESLWQTKASGSYWLSDSEIDIPEQEDMAVKRDRISEILENFKSDIDEVVATNAELTLSLKSIQQPIVEQSEVLLAFMEEEFIERSDLEEAVVENHQRLTSNALQHSVYAYSELAGLLDAVLKQRLDETKSQLQKQLWAIFATVVVALYFFIGMYLSSLNTLRKALATSDQIGSGELGVQFVSETKDEYGVLLERILRSLQNSHFSLIDELPIGVFVTDAAGQCTYTNHTWQKIYGMSLEESLGGGWSKTLHPEDSQKVFSAWQLSAQKKESFSMEFRVLRTDGSLRYVHARARSINQNEFIESGYVGSVEDITERKIMMDQLQKAVVEANAATKAKSEFLANMSHEIRTPMNAIIGLARLCLGTELNAKQRDYIEKVFYSGQSLLGIINDILDFSKIEAGKLEMESIPFYLQEVLSRTQSMMEPKAQEKGLWLYIESDPISGRLVGDPLRLNQVLLNLVNNAIKFTNQGHVVINVNVQEETEDNIRLKFSVKDTGIGMSNEQCGKLFQSFVQADTSITRQFGGTGLGLAISKNLIELMQGKIVAISELGVGTTFYFDAILGRAPADNQDHHDDAFKITQIKELNGINVLVAEDNLINQQVAQEILHQAGMNVVIANNGLEAIEKAKEKIFDVVLMDMQMPVMDGVTAALAITKMESYRNIPVIAMTANAMQSDREECMNAGMVDHIPKPVDPEELFASLIRWVKPRQDLRREPEMPVENKSLPESVVNNLASGELPDSIPGVDLESVLKRLGGNRPFVHKILLSFAKQNADTAKQLTDAIAEKNWELAERISHTLKGTAGTIGLLSVSKTAAELNDALKQKNHENIEPLVGAFTEALNQTIISLQILS
ncbi:MAG: response regulator [Cellvibrio sp.]|nr:response regulator [Cellvibrio sp.]